jgi:hypothetical protein
VHSMTDMVSGAVFVYADRCSRRDLLQRGMHAQSLYRPARDMLRGGAEFQESLLAQWFWTSESLGAARAVRR